MATEINSFAFDKSMNLSDEKLKDKRVVVLFYSPHCGHCVHFKPNFDKAAQQAGDVKFVRVNVQENPDVMDRVGNIGKSTLGYEINGVPTIVAYSGGRFDKSYEPRRGSKHQYRSVEDVLEFARSISSPAEASGSHRMQTASTYQHAAEEPRRMKDQEEEDDLPVKQLTNADFNTNFELKPSTGLANKKVAIFFHLPGCPACVATKPNWKQAVKIGRTALPDVVFAEVNAGEPEGRALLIRLNDKASTAQYRVQGVPSIVSYHKGKYFSTYGPSEVNEANPYEYRTVADILQYSSGIGTAQIHWT